MRAEYLKYSISMANNLTEITVLINPGFQYLVQKGSQIFLTLSRIDPVPHIGTILILSSHLRIGLLNIPTFLHSRHMICLP